MLGLGLLVVLGYGAIYVTVVRNAYDIYKRVPVALGMAVSQYVRDFLVGRGTDPGKVRVVLHGIDMDGRASAGSGPSPIAGSEFIFAVSKFVRYANLETLILAYGEMRRRGVLLPLLLAGGSWDGRYEVEIKRLVAEQGLAASVDFLGYIPRERVIRHLRECSLFLFPSTLEACPFTLLEALASGAPIVTARSGPMWEIAGDAALYFDPKDHHGLADQAVALLGQPVRRAALRDHALDRARKFPWEESISALVHTFEDAVRRGERRR